MRERTSPNTNAACCAAAPSKEPNSGNSDMAQYLPAFERFIRDLRAVCADERDDGKRMERAKPLLERLVMDASIKAHSADWPSTEGRKNLRLYVDADYGFVVNAVVRAPGRKGSV